MNTKVIWVVALAVALVACGSGDDPAAADGGAAARCTDSETLCTTLHVPEEFGGTPRQLLVGLFDSLPPQGPPLVVATIIEQPDIAVGHAFELTATELEDSDPAELLPGDYFIYVVLYMEGGGMFQPEPGIDYVVSTDHMRRVGDQAVNLPDMTFSLAE